MRNPTPRGDMMRNPTPAEMIIFLQWVAAAVCGKTLATYGWSGLRWEFYDR